jgi:hypothetical protein
MGLLNIQNPFNVSGANQGLNLVANANDTTPFYQFVTLDNIINAFMITHVGEGKVISKVNRTEVQFHAMRALQELTYDILRSFKEIEADVPNTLRLALPQDYVNYTGLFLVGSDGIHRRIYPTGKTSAPFAIGQDANGNYSVTPGDPTGSYVQELNADGTNASTSEANFQSSTPVDLEIYDIHSSTDVEISTEGRRYGIDPQHSQMNGTFFIDLHYGDIHFSSNLAGKTVVIKYVSDGLGNDNEMVVHKFCEEACYKWIAYGILSTRSNMPESIVQRYKKERFAETRKAKIRLSNIKMEEFAQVLKGMGKQIK